MTKDYDEEELYVTLDTDDGEIDCRVITIFEALGREYIAMYPTTAEDEMEEDTGVFLYRYYEDEEGMPGLDNIETDEEFEEVSKVFDELLSDEEYDEDID